MANPTFFFRAAATGAWHILRDMSERSISEVAGCEAVATDLKTEVSKGDRIACWRVLPRSSIGYSGARRGWHACGVLFSVPASRHEEFRRMKKIRLVISI